MTAKERFIAIFKPSKRVLVYYSLCYFLLVGIYIGVLINIKLEVRPVFAYIWAAVLSLLALYFIYGYIRQIVLAIIEKKKESKLITAVRKDKDFRSIFTRAAGMFVNFFFVGWYIYKAIVTESSFYWMLMEFYWIVAELKLYLDYILDREEGKQKEVSYIIVNCGLLCLSAIILTISIFVILYDGIFEKSWVTVFIIALYTVYRVVSSSFALAKAHKTKLVYDWTVASLSFSTALYSLYTLVTAMVILFTDIAETKDYAYFGFIAALITIVLGIIGLVSACRRFTAYKKSPTNEDQTL